MRFLKVWLITGQTEAKARETDTMVEASQSCLIPKDDRSTCGPQDGTVNQTECHRLGCCYDPVNYGTHQNLSKCFHGDGQLLFLEYFLFSWKILII